MDSVFLIDDTRLISKACDISILGFDFTNSEKIIQMWFESGGDSFIRRSSPNDLIYRIHRFYSKKLVDR